MRLFNTLSGEKEELQRSAGKNFTMYFCGPTVYNYAHIGNFRTYLLQDVLVRTLNACGYNTCFARNITDVDDKTIRDSIKEGVSLKFFTEKWTKIFHEDCDKLNMLHPTFEPKATENIKEQIDIINDLVNKGFAYIAKDGSVYFNVRKFDRYGELSRLNKRQISTQEFDSAGKKNLADEYDREQVADFALWKASKPEDGENFWESPWGNGRPGWHIECSAMANKYLGPTIDLHSGGVDLKFPHHENEIAQSECFSGKKFSKHWMHISHLLVDGVKMSKSLKNLYTLNDIVSRGFSPESLRYALISAHYKQPLNFTFDSLVASQNALMKLYTFSEKIGATDQTPHTPPVATDWKFFGSAFDELTDDLNTPGCIGNIFKTINETDLTSLSDDDKEKMRKEFEILMYCLGLRLGTGKIKKEVPDEIKELARTRWQLKLDKKFDEADKIRKKISELGWNVKDSKDGYSIEMM